MFIDSHEHSNIEEYQNDLLTKMGDFKPYMCEVDENDAMKPKIYLSVLKLGGDDCTFSVNNRIRRTWTRIGDNFLRSKSRGQGIKSSRFLLLFGQPNLAFLSLEKRDKIEMERIKI